MRISDWSSDVCSSDLLVAVGLVNILHLPPGDTIRSFEKLDLVTFPMLAVGVGLLCAFLVQGRIQWWSTPWLGGALAASVVLIGAAFLIEHYRANPMLQTRWMGSRDLVKFALKIGRAYCRGRVCRNV